MSTVSGVFPNAITPTFAASNDPAEQARLRRQNDSVVFSPVEEVDANTRSQSSKSEQPGRLEAEHAVTTSRHLPNSPAVPSQEATPSNAAVDGQIAELRSTEATRVEDERTEQPALQEDIRSDQREDQTSQQSSRVDARSDDARRQQDRKIQDEQARLDEDFAVIRELTGRDRDVKAHEQAHQSVGGQYAGSMAFEYTRGPDGKRYATGGEVPIDVSRVSGDPEATIRKAEQIRSAALAPAEPSSQDRQVAALANQIAAEASNDVRQIERQTAEKANEERAEQRDLNKEDEANTEASSKADGEKSAESAENNDQRLQTILEQTQQTTESAVDAAYNTRQQQDIGFNLDTTI